MSTPDSTSAPERPTTWRETDDGWEFYTAGGAMVTVPFSAVDTDRPLHEQLAQFAAGLDVQPRPAEDRPRNVIEALARCIAEMPAIGKDQQMGAEGGSQSYKYRSIEAISSHASILFGRYGVVPKVHKTERTVKEFTVRSGGIWTEDYLRVKYRIYGPGGTGDYITTGWFHALARDNSDKGTSKAMTQARKQMLLDLLQVGDNKEDPDSFSPVEDQPERTVEGPPETLDEWCQRNGWEGGKDEMAAAGVEVRAAIRRLIATNDLTNDDAAELWNDYKAPGARTREAHDAWVGEHLPAASEPEAPQEAPSAPEPPAASAEPQPEPETPSGPQEPEKGRDSQDMHPDNGYRGSLDKTYRDRGIDPLVKAIKTLNASQVADSLLKRGDHPPTATADTLRRRLGSIIVRNDTADKQAAKGEKAARLDETAPVDEQG